MIDRGDPRNPLSDHDIAAEFHPTKNRTRAPSDIPTTSMTPVWWLGECGHEWMAMPASRTRTEAPAGCLICDQQATLKEKAAANVARNPLAAHPAAAEFHPTRNGTLTINDFTAASLERVWWLCPACGHEWAATPWSRTDPKRGTGCRICGLKRARLTKAARNPLADHAIAAEFHPTKNPLGVEYYAAGSVEPVWWRCLEGHEWLISPKSRLAVKKHARCPVCSTR